MFISPMQLTKPKKSKLLGQRKIQALLNRPKTKIVHGTEKAVWSDEDRLNAIQQFIITGSMQKVAGITNIPVNTLRDWRKFAPWWKDLEEVLREEGNLERASEITELTDNVIKALEDRVQKGDHHYNPRTGEIVRVPVRAGDLNKLASNLIEKKQMLTKQPTSYTASTDNKSQLESKLIQLAATFEKFTSGQAGKAAQQTLTNIEYAEVVE